MKAIVTDHGWENIDLECAILEPIGAEVVEAQCRDEDQLIEACREVDYVISTYAPLSARVISTLQRCRVISRYGIGVDNIDLKAAREAGIPVCNVPDYCIDEVADHALALLLALTRKVVSGNQVVRDGKWGPPGTKGDIKVLREHSVGLIGFGRIGTAVAARLQAFKCPLLVHDPFVSDEVIEAGGAQSVSFDELLERSDIVSLHCPSDDTTRGMMDADSLGKMRQGALLVNVSRGDLIVTEDLIGKLERGHLNGAAVDVTSPEPLPAGHPLSRLENMVITSHFAAFSVTAIEELRRRAAGAIADAICGEPLKSVVNGVDGPRDIT